MNNNDFLELFGSKTRLRVMLVLLRLGEATLTRIAREAGLNHVIVRKSLEELKRKGIVIEETYDNYTFYRLNYSNPMVSALRYLLESGTKA